MKDIFYNSDSPLAITVAADPRINSTDYINDQIWELSINTGEPQALILQTTYGLRAFSMRLFPRFLIGNEESTNPANFSRAPTFHKIYPNFIYLSYAPFSSIEVYGDYWVPNSQSIAGRFRIKNSGSKTQSLKFELVALLNPSEGGTRILPTEIEGVNVLSGSTENLTPVTFISGGASTVNSPYPALVHNLELSPGSTKQFTWSHSAFSTINDSFIHAREISSCNWDAEIAKVELQNSSLIEVYTGEESWDLAFQLAQKNAYGLLLSNTTHLENISYVTTRIPDNGYSFRQDGSDYAPQWGGQTLLDTYYLCNLLLPAAPELMEKIILNHVDALNEYGEIDWRPGLGGQRSNRLATPLLACIAWKVYQATENKDFLLEIYPKIIRFFFSWFSKKHDRDQDGIPEWDHPLQAGFEDHPIFARWHDWAQGLDITTVESPSLCAFLLQECQSILKIAQILNDSTYTLELETKIKSLRDAVESSWDENIFGYCYRDRDNHSSSKRIILGELHGSGSIAINQVFTDPQRIVFRIKSSQDTTRKTQLIIHGYNATGNHRVEIIPPEGILWFPGWGTASSQQTYQVIDSIEIKGLHKSDTVWVSNAGLLYQDITNFLPLWAHIPTSDRANLLIDKNLTNPETFWKQFGISACPQNDSIGDTDICHHVYLPWCLLIGEGLLAYNFKNQAAELVTKLMNGINLSLSKEGCFRQIINAENGRGSGDIDALWGLAPLGLFLETLGLQIYTQRKMRISGTNPFPWPVTIKFRGMTVFRGLEKTQIIFPDGQTSLIEDPQPCWVTFE